MSELGQVVVLNGAPRSGKSSIVTVMQDSFDAPWMNLGVDVWASATPKRYQPGIGLRPGGERPDLEAMVTLFYAALYESVAAHSRLGVNVVVDVAHHDDYSTPLRILRRAAAQLDGLPALLVGVVCPIEVIMARRDADQPGPGQEVRYAKSAPDGGVPEVVNRWQREVHIPGVYDLEVDTSMLTPAESAAVIPQRLRSGRPPTAFTQLASS